MKKIGIITVHNADNYGAILQCHALNTFLRRKTNKNNIYIINTHDKIISNDYKLISTSSLKSFIKSLLFFPWNALKKYRFNKFRKANWKEVKFENNTIDIDLFVLGSDQIWNMDITKGYNPIYFADIPKKDSAIAISYAASIGKSFLTEDEKVIFREKLKNISAISVRESEAKELIANFTEKEIEILIDPTLLLAAYKWEKLIKNKKIEKQKYLLLYQIAGYTETREIAIAVAKALNLKIIEISTPSIRRYETKKDSTAGPIEFLQLFRDASFIITDSFHGTAFSIIFKKNFYTIPHKTRGVRMVELTEKLGIKNRIITSINEINLADKIDYENVLKIIDIERNKASEYIDNALKMVNIDE